MGAELESLLLEYEEAEAKRCHLLLKVLQLQKKEFYNRVFTGLPGATCSWNGRTLKFVIPDKPPILKRTDFLHEELVALWAGRIVHAYKKAQLNLRFDRILVLIKIVTSDTHYWDVDNRAVALIINGLRATGIIEDDRWQYVSVAVMGAEGSTNRTEVLIVNGKEIDDLWERFDFSMPIY